MDCFRRFEAFAVAAACFFMITPAVHAQAKGCFERLHHGQTKDADYYFDLRFDTAPGGGSFSCDLDIRASEARKAIDDLRFAVLYQSESHLRRAVKFPVKISTFESLEVQSSSRTVEIRNEKEWQEFMKTNLDANNLATIACANLHNVTIVKGRSYGFMIAAGTVWFQRAPADQRPRVTSINLGPVPEKALVDACMVKR